MKTPSLLVIDDEAENFDVIETFLTDQNYQFYYLSRAKETFNHLDTFQPDLILLDLMMPDIDGIELCQRIKAHPKWQSLPIIMITALNSKEDLARCLNAGADDFLDKPINRLELRARVQSLLRIKKQYDNIEHLCQVQRDTITMLESTLNQLRGNFASRLSHELNTPLNGIIGVFELLQYDLEEMEISEIRELLELANQSARRLEESTQKILIYLELATAYQDKLNFGATPLSTSIIESSLHSHAQTFNRSDDFIYNIQEAEIYLSQRYLSIILQELVENALQFSSPKTPIEISTQATEDTITLSIHDFGEGLNPKQVVAINNLMSLDYQLDEKQRVLGMGLRIVRKILSE